MKLRDYTSIKGGSGDSGQMVGKPEVILGPDLFGGQVVDALLYCVGYRKLTAIKLDAFLYFRKLVAATRN